MNSCALKYLLLLSVAISLSAQEKTTAIQLCPDIIGLIDGRSFGIHGELVGSVYKIARDVQAMQLGKRTIHGRVGTHTFENTQHTIKSLAIIERTLEGIMKNGTKAERVAAEKRLTRLNELLQSMKMEFNAIVAPFLGQARGAKEPMFLLIAESCVKRNVPKSLLLNWAKSTEDETTSLNKSVTSFALFDDFCTDLVNFLGDLVYSCPKARAQFEQLKRDYTAKQK